MTPGLSRCKIWFLWITTDLVNMVGPIHPAQPEAWWRSWCSSSWSGYCPENESHRSHWIVSTGWKTFEKKGNEETFTVKTYCKKCYSVDSQNKPKKFLRSNSKHSHSSGWTEGLLEYLTESLTSWIKQMTNSWDRLWLSQDGTQLLLQVKMSARK